MVFAVFVIEQGAALHRLLDQFAVDGAGAGGIGVRELALIGLLHPFLGPISAAVAVAARLWNMVVEIIAVIIAWRVPMPAENSERDLTGLPPEPPA